MLLLLETATPGEITKMYRLESLLIRSFFFIYLNVFVI